MVEVNKLGNKDEKEMELTKPQTDFLEFCMKYGWGKLEVTVKNGEPVFSRELEHDHKHG
ncbi:hypothetical protein KKE60_04540 [Patescibacteria group bacterium]|nr:hypothetical protein [Patescibacteria group bacterium]